MLDLSAECWLFEECVQTAADCEDPRTVWNYSECTGRNQARPDMK